MLYRRWVESFVGGLIVILAPATAFAQGVTGEPFAIKRVAFCRGDG